MVNPERLALDLVADARATGPHARSANYVEAIGTTATGVLLRDVVLGREFAVDANVVINTTGPWTDMTNSALGAPSTFMGGTKGLHIVLENPELFAACNGGEVFFENNDGRIVLIYPLNGKVLVGTTDIEADITKPAVCTDEEVGYFFELVSHVFPKIAVNRSQIVFRYSGIRPLPRHDDTAPGFVSRDYRIERTDLASGAGATTKVPMLSVVGGKWTSFRALAEHITNDTLAILGEKRSVSTESLAIGGGVGFPAEGPAQKAWVTVNGASVSAERGLALLRRYGTGAACVIAGIAARGDGMLEHVPGFSVGELAYLASTESVVHITDVVLRRTTVAFVGGLSQAAFDEISVLMAEALGWSPEQHDAERTFAVDELTRLHGLSLVAAATSSSRAA